MIKADEYLTSTLKELRETPYRDQQPRAHYKDGEPAYSKFITQKQFKYDISKGEFPINTLRNTAIKGAFQELKTIYIDQSNKEADFVGNSVDWWGDWMSKEGNLGKAYSFNLEPDLIPINRELIQVARRKGKNSPTQDIPEFKEIFTKEIHTNANRAIEGKFCNYRILEKISCFKYRIQLLDCGHILESRIRADVMSPYYKSIGGLFYYGDYHKSNLSEQTISSLMSIWRNMADRITGKSKNNSKYDLHNIDTRWLNFSNFLKDVVTIPQFFSAKRDNFKGWCLDKDYFGAEFYSKDTCVFISGGDNLLYRENQKLYKVDGKVFGSSREVGHYLGITGKKVGYLLNYQTEKMSKINKSLKDRIEVLNVKDELYRYPLQRNQMNELLDTLVMYPFSRRHRISLFNWTTQGYKQLEECAYETLWSVRDEIYLGDTLIRYIDLTLNQRSMDYVMTSSINPTQYVMFGMAVCGHLTHKTGIKHELGVFSHNVQNLHVYERHMWALDELLSRTPKEQPTIRLRGNKNFYDYTIEDFEIILPQGIEKLSKELELAV
jgi:thymidylate synthase